MRSRVLLISHRGDPHADLVAGLLAARGCDAVQMCTSDLPGAGSMECSLSNDADLHAVLSTPQGRVDLADLRAVWHRNAMPHRACADLPEDERRWAEAETQNLITSLWTILAHCPEVTWLGEPHTVRAASSKVEQLRRARSMGFSVPDTLISTHPGQIEQFVQAHQHTGVIHKDLGTRFLSMPTMTWDAHEDPPVLHLLQTTRVTAQHLEHSDTIILAPCLVQAFVPKSTELRVTVIDDETFVCGFRRKDQSTSWMTAKDLDGYSHAFDLFPADLPDAVRRMCIHFVHSYGLRYGALDLALTPEGAYVFFEMNPEGGWFDIQEQVPSLDMASAVTDLLLTPRSSAPDDAVPPGPTPAQPASWGTR